MLNMCTVVASSTAVSDAPGARRLGHASIGMSVAGIVISIVVAIILGVLLARTAADAVSYATDAASSSCNYHTPLGTCYRYKKYVGYTGYCSGVKYDGDCYYDY